MPPTINWAFLAIEYSIIAAIAALIHGWLGEAGASLFLVWYIAGQVIIHYCTRDQRFNNNTLRHYIQHSIACLLWPLIWWLSRGPQK